MGKDIPEVWVEIIRKGNNARNILYGQFYREHSKMRGEKSITDTGSFIKQRERLADWIEKLTEICELEDKYIVVWGDFNTYLSKELNDPLKEDIQENLLETT